MNEMKKSEAERLALDHHLFESYCGRGITVEELRAHAEQFIIIPAESTDGR